MYCVFRLCQINYYHTIPCPRSSCPGLLYYKADDVCVHPSHVCDGVVDCKLSLDDEAFWDVVICYPGCQCHGYAIFCEDVDMGKQDLLILI